MATTNARSSRSSNSRSSSTPATRASSAPVRVSRTYNARTGGFIDDPGPAQPAGDRRYTQRATTRNSHQEDGKAAVQNTMFADAETMKEKLREAMCAKQYDVCDFYKTVGVWQAIARSVVFERITLAVILFNAVWIWIDTDHNPNAVLMSSPWPFQVVEYFFCVFFSYEWTVRFMAFRHKRDGFKDAWFVFDTAMVVVMVAETWVVNLLLVLMDRPEGFAASGNAGVMRLLRLVRMTRMARMARLLRAMPELLILIKGMVAAFRSVLFTLVLLLVVLYVFGIAFRLFTDDTTIGRKKFGSVPESMHTLLLNGTLMDDIGQLVRSLGQCHFGLVFLFYVFFLISALTVLNMLIGVLVEVVSAVAAAEREELTVTYVKSRVQSFLKEEGLDTNGDGMISKEEFRAILGNQAAARTLAEVGVDVFGLVDLQDHIFSTEGDDPSGVEEERQLTFGDFIKVVLDLRGTNTATVKDIVNLRKFMLTQTKTLEEKIIGGLRASGEIGHDRYQEFRDKVCLPKLKDAPSEPSSSSDCGFFNDFSSEECANGFHKQGDLRDAASRIMAPGPLRLRASLEEVQCRLDDQMAAFKRRLEADRGEEIEAECLRPGAFPITQAANASESRRESSWPLALSSKPQQREVSVDVGDGCDRSGRSQCREVPPPPIRLRPGADGNSMASSSLQGARQPQPGASPARLPSRPPSQVERMASAVRRASFTTS